MAEYTRFAFLLPTFYRTEGADGPVIHQVDAALIQRFFNATVARFRGLSDSGSEVGPLYAGYWRETMAADMEIDELTYAFCLVKRSDTERALRFFAGWKRRIEEGLHQEIILVLHSPVQTIGGELSA